MQYGFPMAATLLTITPTATTTTTTIVVDVCQ